MRAQRVGLPSSSQARVKTSETERGKDGPRLPASDETKQGVFMDKYMNSSEFSLENEVFKPFFCGQTVGKYVTFVAATAVTRILLRPLPDH